MGQLSLQQAVEDVPSLRAVFVTAMPDCLLYDSWVRSGEDWIPENIASYFGDLVRANREGLKGLHAWSAEMQVTIESADLLLVLRELRDFVIALAFERSAPLGMVRVHINRILARLSDLLPPLAPEERPRALLVVEFLEKYAPDPHAVMQRVALRTGISIEELRQPERLDAGQLERLEGSVKEILGLDALAM
ncbi:MAG: hypothetical protein HY903_04505 [Deltaproteobacteria bacterium]|nr:hypothetical protein [Deltaproteobacteria bacterium]